MDITHPDSFRVCNIPFCTTFATGSGASNAGTVIGFFLCHLVNGISASGWGLGAPCLLEWEAHQKVMLEWVVSYAI